VIAEPPFEAGAENVSVTLVVLPVACVIEGAPGVVAGVTADDAVEYVPVPTAFTAATRKM
jgi:hypothetical protein